MSDFYLSCRIQGTEAHQQAEVRIGNGWQGDERVFMRDGASGKTASGG